MRYDVLVIDDEASLARNIKDFLECEGWVAQVCGDGESGVTAFASCRAPVVVLDLRLPGIDGMAVLARLRAESPDVRVIVISAHGSADAGTAALAAGAYGYLAKPLSLSELGGVVARARTGAASPWHMAP